MLLNRLQNSPQKAVRVAMALLVVGLALVVISARWSHKAPASTDGQDFARGFLIGIGIVLEITAIVIAAGARRRRCQKA